MAKKIKTIEVVGNKITILRHNGNDYISISDMASYKNQTAPKDVVRNWMRNRASIEFLGLWEMMNNPAFKGVEFDAF